MKTLAEQFTPLTSKVSITVPSTDGVKAEACEYLTERTVEIVLSDLSLWFGGATAYAAQGAYKATDGTLVKEAVTVVTANCEALTADDEHNLITLAELVKSRHKQECVALEIDGKMYFI